MLGIYGRMIRPLTIYSHLTWKGDRHAIFVIYIDTGNIVLPIPTKWRHLMDFARNWMPNSKSQLLIYRQFTGKMSAGWPMYAARLWTPLNFRFSIQIYFPMVVDLAFYCMVRIEHNGFTIRQDFSPFSLCFTLIEQDHQERERL